MHMGQLTLDLFASRLCHQLPLYITWKLELDIIAARAFLHPWDREYSFSVQFERLNSKEDPRKKKKIILSQLHLHWQIQDKKTILLFPEMRVMRKIFIWAAANLFFLIDFPEIFSFLLQFLLLFSYSCFSFLFVLSDKKHFTRPIS